MAIEDSINALVAAFNRGSLDVPSGLFTPQTTFSLNDRSYEAILGASADDPLIRLLTRGVAGYRTAAKALQYALQHPTISLECMSDRDAEGVQVAILRVQGQLRDSNEPFAGHCSLKLTCINTQLMSVDVSCGGEDLSRLGAARG